MNTTEGQNINNELVKERYKFLKSKLARSYYIIRDAWGHKLHYNPRTKQIDLDGRILDLDFIRLEIAMNFNLDIGRKDGEFIIKELAIINTYPSMDQEDQKVFAKTYFDRIDAFRFTPTIECPTVKRSQSVD